MHQRWINSIELGGKYGWPGWEAVANSTRRSIESFAE
jgi:glucose/arabinose dehydrogenase